MSDQADYLDELLAKQAKSGASAPAAASSPEVDHIDAMLAARAKSNQPATPVAAPKAGQPGHFWSDLGNTVYDGTMALGQRLGNVPAATAERGWGGNVVDLAKAGYHNIAAPVNGINQKTDALIAAAVHQLAPGSSMDQKMSGNVADLGNKLGDWEDNYQKDTPDSTGALIGATAANVFGWGKHALGGALDVTGNAVKAAVGAPTRALAAATKTVPYVRPVTNAVAKTVDAAANAAGKGAVIGGTQTAPGATTAADVGSATAEGMLVGAGVGTAAGPVAKVTSDQVVKPVARLWNPMRVVGENLPKIAGVDPADYVSALRGEGAQTFVPGSAPTVAQAGALGLGSKNAKIIELERFLRSRSPDFRTGFNAQSMDNNGARWDAVDGVALDDDAYKAAKGARSSAADPLYKSAYATPVTADPVLDDIAATTAFKKALARAQTNIASNDVPPRQVVTQAGAPGSSAPSAILDANGNPISTTVTPAAPTQYSTEGLHDTIGGLQALEGDATQGLDGKETRAIAGVRQKLTDWLSTNNPDFGKAQAAYQEGSIPLNNMDAGRSITKGLEGASDSGAGQPRISFNKYSNLLSQATDPDKVEFPPDAATTARLTAVKNDLQRATVSNAGGGPNSDTAFNLGSDDWFSRWMNPSVESGPSASAGATAAGVGAFVDGGTGVGAALYGLGKGSSWLNARLLKAYELGLMNPSLAADAMEKYNPSSSTGPLTSVPASAARDISNTSTP